MTWQNADIAAVQQAFLDGGLKMNRCTLTVFMACLLAVPVAQAADDEDHAAHHPGADQSQAAPAQDDKAVGMKMEEMQDRLKKMQDLMSKIHSTSDPQERAKLMKEHMAAMLEAMRSMHAMMGKGGMMAKKKGRDDAGAEKDSHQHGDGAASGSPSSDQGGEMMMGGMMMKMHKKMQERMDAMQKMMEQIVEHEAVEEEMTGK
jgi:periplasmic protein CpxP/Spy